MDTFAGFILLLVAGLVSSAPGSNEVFTVTPELFPDPFATYTSEHDIVNIFCPLNSLNFDEDIQMEAIVGNDKYVFFIEADIVNDKYDYKASYVLKNKIATKLLDNGKDFAASKGNNKHVYIAATDGIYVYNVQENKADKYGSITDSLIGIAASESLLYVLTEDNVLYKVTNEGRDKEIVNDVKNAVQIVLDHDNNLFFLDSKKNVYVKTKAGTIIKIRDIPANPSFAKLVRPPYSEESGIPYVTDKKVFELSPHGTSEHEDIYLQTRPTAFSVDAGILQYYAYEKKIYEYNIRAIALGEISMQMLQSSLGTKSGQTSLVRSKSRKFFSAP